MKEIEVCGINNFIDLGSLNRGLRAEVIKISVKGLAKFMTASPAGQRRVLRDFKFPDEDEPKAMRLYYGEAVDAVKAYHNGNQDRQWLLDQAGLLTDLATSLGGQSGVRLRNNSRAVKQYAENFHRRRFTVLGDLRLALMYGDVRVTIAPDLHVRERTKEKIIKLDFSNRAPEEGVIQVVSQCMFEAFRSEHGAITPSSVLYLAVSSGAEHRGARVGSRMQAEVRAACDNITALWDTITR